MPRRNDLKALRSHIHQAYLIISNPELAEGGSARVQELLNAAIRLADDLLAVKPAAVLGSKGGKKTAQRGPDYFRQIAAMRKTRGGGRPRKHE